MTSLGLESIVPHHGQFRGASPSEHLLSESPWGPSWPWLIKTGPSNLKSAPNRCSTPAPTEEGPGHPDGRSPRGSPGRGVSPSALICTLGVLVGFERGPSRWCRTGQATSGLRGWVLALPSLVLVGGQYPQAQLPFQVARLTGRAQSRPLRLCRRIGFH